MTTIALLPLAVGCFAAGTILTWPLAHRSGRRSAAKAERRDQAEIGRILTGFDAAPVLVGAAPDLTAHAAPTPEPNWNRGEHRIYSWGWLVEIVARLLSIRAKANLPVVVEEYKPRHGDWRVSTQELALVVAEESRRRDDEFEALLYSLVAKGKVLR